MLCKWHQIKLQPIFFETPTTRLYIHGCHGDKCLSVMVFCQYNAVKMGVIASQITSLKIVCSIVYSDTDQRKHQSSESLAFVWGIRRGPANSPHEWPVARKMFPFDDVIMHKAFWTHIVMNDIYIYGRVLLTWCSQHCQFICWCSWPCDHGFDMCSTGWATGLSIL